MLNDKITQRETNETEHYISGGIRAQNTKKVTKVLLNGVVLFEEQTPVGTKTTCTQRGFIQGKAFAKVCIGCRKRK